jgi:hypothetical protein
LSVFDKSGFRIEAQAPPVSDGAQVPTCVDFTDSEC